MVETLVTMLTGIVIGILGSLFAWWILFHCVVPRVRFSPYISKTESGDDESPYDYRIKFENAGRRVVLDLEIFAKLRIKGLRRAPYPTNWRVIYIPLKDDRIPKILPAKKKGIRYVFRLLVNEASELDSSIFPEYLRTKYKQNRALLEDLLNLGVDRTLQVVAFGYDEFSGARRVFESKLYGKEDIKCGPFEPKGLEIEEDLRSEAKPSRSN